MYGSPDFRSVISSGVNPGSPDWRSFERCMYSASSPVHRAIGMYSHPGVMANASLSARHNRLTERPIRSDQYLEWRTSYVEFGPWVKGFLWFLVVSGGWGCGGGGQPALFPRLST